jgi:hypothetical protein
VIEGSVALGLVLNSQTTADPDLVETIEAYDEHLFTFADHTKPALSKLHSAQYDGGELSPDNVRALLHELREIGARLRNEGTDAWPNAGPGPNVQLTNANVERFIATCDRICALLEIAVQRQASIWLDSD